MRNNTLLRKYGITEQRYNEMLDAQGGVCAICERPPKGRPLTVDHCHDTGVIRGLLCGCCNSALGLLAENSFVAGQAWKYLAAYAHTVPYKPWPPESEERVQIADAK